MTDGEMVELAAKAVGFIHNSEIKTNYPMLWGYWKGDKHQNLRHWDPLEEDGDALRLAVELNLLVNIEREASVVRVLSSISLSRIVHIEQSIDADPYAATRRAIVRAAAEIGRNMP